MDSNKSKSEELKKTKFSFEELQVESFVTSLTDEQKETVEAGVNVTISSAPCAASSIPCALTTVIATTVTITIYESNHTMCPFGNC